MWPRQECGVEGQKHGFCWDSRISYATFYFDCGHGVDTWASFLDSQEALSPTTVANYCWWASGFLAWLQEQNVPLRQITLAKVDGFMDQLASKGLSRVTLATAAKALRRFLRYAYEQFHPRRFSNGRQRRLSRSSTVGAPRLFDRDAAHVNLRQIGDAQPSLLRQE